MNASIGATALLSTILSLALLAQSSIAQSTPATGPAPAMRERTEVFVGQAFDTCEIPSLSALQTWFVESPYRAVNLYIGGSGRFCSNRPLNADLLSGLGDIGWKFIPTWVGPQAPCYAGNKPRMSADALASYAQGVAEADAAIKVAVDLGLALPDGSGTIVYYDMEHFDFDDLACREAVLAFISGWTAELRSRGNLVGVYGNGQALSSYATLANVPDAVWPARWIYTYYTPDATVWDVPNLSNTLWVDHQRIRQYAGGHTETWGGVSLNIDCDVVDGIVATVKPRVPTHFVYLPVAVGEGVAP